MAALKEALPGFEVRKTALSLDGEIVGKLDVNLGGWSLEETERGRRELVFTMSGRIGLAYDGDEEDYLAEEEALAGHLETIQETLHYVAGSSGLLSFEVVIGAREEGASVVLADFIWQSTN